VVAAVFRNGPAGTPLDFYYQITNNSLSSKIVDRTTDFNFSDLINNYTTDVFYRTAGDAALTADGFVTGTVAPISADRVDPATVGFNFTSPTLPAGSTSNVLVIKTGTSNI